MKKIKSGVKSGLQKHHQLIAACIMLSAFLVAAQITNIVSANVGSLQYSAVKIIDGGTGGGGGGRTGVVYVSTYNNPKSGPVRDGATGVTFGNIKLSAIYEAENLQQLKVFVNDGGILGTANGNYQDIVTVYLYKGQTMLGSAAIPSSGFVTINIPAGTFSIPRDGDAYLTIKADIAAINPGADNAPGTPNADIAFNLADMKFVGASSNVEPTIIDNGTKTAAKILHKTVPTVTYSSFEAPLGAATSLTNGSVNLYQYRISADAQGNSFLLYRNSFQIYKTPEISIGSCYVKNADGVAITATSSPLFNGANGLISFTYNNPLINAGNDLEAIAVPAGTSATFSLNCQIAGARAGSYIAVSLLGDNPSFFSPAEQGTQTFKGQNIAAAYLPFQQGNFVWSDNYKNRGLDTDGANATNWGQWYNGNLLSELGSTPTTSAYAIGWSSSF